MDQSSEKTDGKRWPLSAMAGPEILAQVGIRRRQGDATLFPLFPFSFALCLVLCGRGRGGGAGVREMDCLALAGCCQLVLSCRAMQLQQWAQGFRAVSLSGGTGGRAVG